MTQSTYLLVVGVTMFFAWSIAKFIITPATKKEYIATATQDISEQEMIKLENNLSAFLAENDLSPGDSIWKVAHALRVVDIGSVDNLSSRARISEQDVNGDFTVVHNVKIPDNERLFDFAHELGHMINKDPLPADRPQGYDKPQRDQLADYTAAALLMPLEHIHQFLIENNYEAATNKERVTIVKKLSKKYHVNEITTVRRVNEVRKLKNMLLNQ